MAEKYRGIPWIFVETVRSVIVYWFTFVVVKKNVTTLRNAKPDEFLQQTLMVF